MDKSLREKMLSLNGKKVRLLTPYGEYDGVLDTSEPHRIWITDRRLTKYGIISMCMWDFKLEEIIDIEDFRNLAENQL